MADATERELVPINPWQPGDVVDPTRGMIPDDTFGRLQQQVGAFMDDPRVRSQMMAFAVNALQPLPWGQTQTGHLAGAVGAAGEAGTRYDTERRAEEESKSKAAAREQRAGSAEQRAQAAADKLKLEQEKIQLRRDIEEGRAEGRLSLAKLRAVHNYAGMQKSYEEAKRKAEMMNTAPPPAPESIDAYLGRLGLGGSAPGTAGGARPERTHPEKGVMVQGNDGLWYPKAEYAGQ